MRKEYDFSKGVRGKYVKKYGKKGLKKAIKSSENIQPLDMDAPENKELQKYFKKMLKQFEKEWGKKCWLKGDIKLDKITDKPDGSANLEFTFHKWTNKTKDE